MSPYADPIRVAHVITRLCRGGAQENTFHTVRLSQGSPFHSDLIAGLAPPEETSMEPAVLASGVAIRHIPALQRAPSPVQDLRALIALYRLFRRERYTIVHTHTSKAGFLGRLAARWAGVPYIVHTSHGNIFHDYFEAPTTRFYVMLERWAAGFTDRMMELTASGVEEHAAMNIGRPNQFRVIFSGIDVAPYEDLDRKRLRNELGISPDATVVGAVGRLEPVKGFIHLFKALERVVATKKPLVLVVAGDGSERRTLELAAAKLEHTVHFLGFREDIPDLMAGFDMLVVPSLNEGMGRVVLEAGAAGIPVIASDVGGIPDILDHEVTGLLAPPRDEGALTAAITRLADDPDARKKMGGAARARVMPHFSLESMVHAIHAVYEELLDERST